MDEDSKKCLVVIVFIVMLIVMFISGYDVSKEIVRGEAIKNNCAEYVFNKDTGKSEFKWINKK